ncbi:MAG: ATP-binding cassette domain-containing protein [Methanosarcina barkeri]|nr:ATP-binding cassette domain-containing protein [Methanosarcina sp. ERenArc_MAG2]
MQNILSVQSLTKKFDDFTAVKDISFNVETGSIFAFLGPNGAGKSTTIKMLTTVLKPTSGEISINGFNVLKEQDRARASFGIVFQDHSLDDELTAYENVVYHAVIYKVPKKKGQKESGKLWRSSGFGIVGKIMLKSIQAA